MLHVPAAAAGLALAASAKEGGAFFFSTAQSFAVAGEAPLLSVAGLAGDAALSVPFPVAAAADAAGA